jgi:O-antigen biosynthesis protein
MKPSVSIVIPSWNGLEILKRFLPSVIASAARYAEQSLSPVEIIIVDDGSSDLTIEWLVGRGFTGERAATLASTNPENQPAPLAPRLRFISNKANLGFGEACNRGFQAASGGLVFLLNNDVEIDIDAIAPLVENFSDDSIFAAHCRVVDLESGRECGTGKVGSFSRGFIRVHQSFVPVGLQAKGAGGEDSPPDPKLYSMFAGGGSAMFDREKFLELGGFERLLSPFYWEDVELSYRAWKRGYSVLYEPRSLARHRVSSTIRKLNKRKVRRIEQRNRLIYHWIHLHDWRMMASHAAWVLALALTAPLRLRPGFLLSTFDALRLLTKIRRRRDEEKRASKRNDRELFAIFESFQRRPDVLVYDHYEEMLRLKQMIQPESSAR